MPNPTDTPVNQVMEMRNQGLSNNQITQTLQRQGYNSTQIYDALNQADMKGGVEPVSPESMQYQEPENPMPANPTTTNLQSGPESPAPQYTQTEMPAEEPEQYYQPSSVGTEELVESIIDEKWEELMKNINKVIEWKNKTETRIIAMEQKIENLKENFAQLQRAITGKIGDYDKHITDVGTEIKALEKVFQKVLPTFTENVNELSVIANKFRKTSSPAKNVNVKNITKKVKK
jgi:prefoldin subunit 5